MQTIDDVLAQCIRDLVEAIETLAREKRELKRKLNEIKKQRRINHAHH